MPAGALCHSGPSARRELAPDGASYEQFVILALAEADRLRVTALAINETSRAKVHTYVMIAADAEVRTFILVADEWKSQSIAALADDLFQHDGNPEAIRSVSIDMSPANIKGVTDHLPDAQITFD